MYYIYQLSYDNNPFYIGMSVNPALRYMQHLSGIDNNTRKFVAEKLTLEIYPTLSILGHYVDKYEAMSAEKNTINELSKTCLLANRDHNSYENLSAIEILNLEAKVFKLKKYYEIPAQISFNTYLISNNLKEKKAKVRVIKIMRTDFTLAKDIFNTLDAHNEVLIEVAKVGNFRKYLRDHSKGTGKEYVTKMADDKLRVSRIK